MTVTVKKKHSVPTKTNVSKENPDGSSENITEGIGHTLFDEPNALIHYQMGLTKSTGVKFEFIRCDVSITLPCKPTPEDIEEAYISAKDWVDSKLSELNDEIQAQIEG